MSETKYGQAGIVTDGIRATGRRSGELLYRFEARLEFVAIGVVPEGLRMANPYEGRVTEGEFVGARVWGIDHLLVRTDGVSVIDSQKTISSGDRHIYEYVRGYCLPPAGLEMPPLEALLSPGFEWPDILVPVQGFSMLRSGDPELAHLNRAIARIDGWANFATGGLAVETRLVGHRGEVAGPGGAGAAGAAG